MKLSVVQRFSVGANTASLTKRSGASSKAQKGLSTAAAIGGAAIGAVSSAGLIFAADGGVKHGVTIGGNASGGIPGLINNVGKFVAQIYTSISGIVTVLALLVVIAALVIRLVAQDPKTVQMATMALKKAIICWIIINTVGYFLTTGTQFVDGGGVTMDSNWGTGGATTTT